MISPVDLFILTAATFFLAWFVARMSGPWAFMRNIRKALRTPPGEREQYYWCWKCAAFWAGALMLLCWYWGDLQPYGTWFVMLWAIPGTAIIIGHYTGANHD